MMHNLTGCATEYLLLCLNNSYTNNLTMLSNLDYPKPEIPDSITQNLNPTFELRECQKEAFAKFLLCIGNNFPGEGAPLYFLFEHGYK